MTVDHLTVDYYLKKGCYPYPHHLDNHVVIGIGGDVESDRFYRRLSDNSSSGVSSSYDESASSDTSEGPSDHIISSSDVSLSSRSTTPSLVTLTTILPDEIQMHCIYCIYIHIMLA